MKQLTRKRTSGDRPVDGERTHVRFGCPTCNAHQHGDIVQQADVGANYGGEFDQNGQWQDDGKGAEMLWDVVSVHGFYCRRCGTDFDKSVKIEPGQA